MLLNLSNHPSSAWSEAQREAALSQFEEIEDMPFPQIDPHATTEDIQDLAQQYAKRLHNRFEYGQTAIHIMGEMTFTFALVTAFKNSFECYASTTERVSEEKDGIKTSVFRFVQFREY